MIIMLHKTHIYVSTDVCTLEKKKKTIWAEKVKRCILNPWFKLQLAEKNNEKNQAMGRKRFVTAGVNACFSHLEASTPTPHWLTTGDLGIYLGLPGSLTPSAFCGETAARLETWALRPPWLCKASYPSSAVINLALTSLSASIHTTI